MAFGVLIGVALSAIFAFSGIAPQSASIARIVFFILVAFFVMALALESGSRKRVQ